MKGIRARFGRGVDLRGGAAKLRGRNSGLDVELVQGIDRRPDDVGIKVNVSVFHSVERVIVVLQTLPGNRIRFGSPLATLYAGAAASATFGGDVRAESD